MNSAYNDLILVFWSIATHAPIPGLNPIQEQIHVYRKHLWICALIFPFATVWFAHGLHRLEIGAMNRVRLFEPTCVPIATLGPSLTAPHGPSR